jgi:hypothetical protein
VEKILGCFLEGFLFYVTYKDRVLSHTISGEKSDASHMCARIQIHTYDRQNECNIIDSKNVTRGLNNLLHSFGRHEGR